MMRERLRMLSVGMNISDSLNPKLGVMDNEDISHGDWSIGRTLTEAGQLAYKMRVEQDKKRWNLLRQKDPPTRPPTRPPVVVVTNNFTSPNEIDFCLLPTKEHIHFVVERHNLEVDQSLLGIIPLTALCTLQNQITNMPEYEKLCERDEKTNKCCEPWTLPNLIAKISHQPNCSMVQVYVFFVSQVFF